MFHVNKARAHVRPDVVVRLIKLKYTENGNPFEVRRENTCAEDLLEYAPAVMAIVQKLDLAFIDLERTGKWRKLRVHDDDDEFIPPGAKHLKGTALCTSQSIHAIRRG